MFKTFVMADVQPRTKTLRKGVAYKATQTNYSGARWGIQDSEGNYRYVQVTSKCAHLGFKDDWCKVNAPCKFIATIMFKLGMGR